MVYLQRGLIMKRYIDLKDSEALLKKLDSFFLAVGEMDDYAQFAVTILKELRTLISYDQAVGIFVNAAGKVMDCHLIGVSQNWGYTYKEYYAKLQSQFPLGMEKDRSREKNMSVQPIIWSELPDNEFIADCIRVRGVKHSLDFTLFDNRGQSRLVLALDRTRPEPYSRQEVELINHIIPHLDNLHRKFFLTVDPDVKIGRRKDALMEMGMLTTREKEVVSCLCEGIPPGDICNVMNISRATIYKLIANIYKKLNINNQQELLVYFLNEYKNS